MQNWKRQWGYVLAVIANVKSAVYMLALSATTVATVQAGVTQDLSQVGLWAFIGVASLAAVVFLLGNFRPTIKTHEN